MRILLDLDGIVVNLADAWYATHNALFGDDLTVEKVTHWDTARFTKYGAAVFDVLRMPGFYRGLKPMPGAIEGVDRLVGQGHEVVIVTAVPRNAPASYGGKEAWVAEHLPMVKPENLIITGAKHMVKGDILFDDGPHNLLDYYNAWPEARLATVEYPYNGEAVSRLRRETSHFLVAGSYRDLGSAWRAFTSWVDGLDVAAFQTKHAAHIAASKGR